MEEVRRTTWDEIDKVILDDGFRVINRYDGEDIVLDEHFYLYHPIKKIGLACSTSVPALVAYRVVDRSTLETLLNRHGNSYDIPDVFIEHPVVADVYEGEHSPDEDVHGQAGLPFGDEPGRP